MSHCKLINSIAFLTFVLLGNIFIISVSGEIDALEIFDFNNFLNTRNQSGSYWPLITNALLARFDFGNVSGNVSHCYESLKEMAIAAFTKKEEWALSMFDAFGKPGAGILDGNVMWAGDYRQCLEVNNGQISSRYCWVEYPLNTMSSNRDQTLYRISRKALRIGVCVPNTCNKKELEELIGITKRGIQNIFGYKDQTFPSINVKCIDSPPVILKDDPVAITAIGVCCTFVFLMILGTILDIQTRNRKKSDEILEKLIEKKNGYADYNQNGNHVHMEPKYVFENKNEPSKFALFLICFSVYTNGKQLFTLKHSNNSLPEFNGLRTIAALAVVFGHTYLFTWHIVDNPLEMSQVMGCWYMQIPANLHHFVDIFLIITGFLTMQVVLKQYVAAGRSCNFSFISSYICHRYWRLVTTYGLILFVSRIGLVNYFGSGPLWQNMDPYCRVSWWKNLLFISNLWPLEQQCYATSWYMSVCMQFHLLALLIIIPLFSKRYRLLSVINGLVMLIISWCWIGSISYENDLLPSYSTINRRDISYYLEKTKIFRSTIYMSPFYHIGPYLAGMATGWILHEYNNVIVLSKKQLTVGWTLSCVLGLGTVHLIYFNPNRMIKSLHMALSTTIWGICISWIILTCNTGNGGFIRSFLSWKCWLPLSKLALTIYLIQGTVIDYMSYTELAPLHFSEFNFFGMFLRHWLVSAVFAIPVSLAFEAPVFAIEKFITNLTLIKKDSTCRVKAI